MTEKREFDNPFNDRVEQKLLGDDGKILQPFQGQLKENIQKHLLKLESGLRETDQSDYTIYTGTTGIALFYFHLSITLYSDDSNQQDELRKKALTILKDALRRLKGKRVSFLCGDAGVYAVAAVLYSKVGEAEKSEKYVEKLCSLCSEVVSDESLSDELLYGRAGYLYSLLFVKNHLGDETVSDAVLEQVVSAILNSGLSLSRKERSRSPLMYSWHGKHYVGAAHGIVGIMFMLLQVYPNCKLVASHISEIQNCIDYLLSKQFSSGNFPSSLENESDRLIHWCHGAPGAVYLMLKAYKVFNEQKYLDAATKCGNVVWKRGLLRKGYGICHGVAGNAYVFLALFKETGNQVYLRRAIKFAEWSFDYGKHNCRTPDRPYSLFEGLAGTLYFWSDLFEPQMARFPAFEL